MISVQLNLDEKLNHDHAVLRCTNSCKLIVNGLVIGNNKRKFFSTLVGGVA